jgi:hypothetical protein
MAMGPSMILMILASGTSFGGILKKYPPPLPFLLSSTPSFFSSSKMFSRNLRGILLFFEISAISVGSLAGLSAMYISA